MKSTFFLKIKKKTFFSKARVENPPQIKNFKHFKHIHESGNKFFLMCASYISKYEHFDVRLTVKQIFPFLHLRTAHENVNLSDNFLRNTVEYILRVQILSTCA